MSHPIPPQLDLDADLVLRAYAMGVFPMADHRLAASVYWVEPKLRGILPLDSFHLSRSLRKTILAERFTVTVDTAFEQIIQLCAESAADRPDTWINGPIERVFIELHRRVARGFRNRDNYRLRMLLIGGGLSSPHLK